MMIAAPQRAVDRARQIVLAYAPLMVTVRQVMYRLAHDACQPSAVVGTVSAGVRVEPSREASRRRRSSASLPGRA